jgi:hypothetical protein
LHSFAVKSLQAARLTAITAFGYLSLESGPRAIHQAILGPSKWT